MVHILQSPNDGVAKYCTGLFGKNGFWGGFFAELSFLSSDWALMDGSRPAISPLDRTQKRRISKKDCYFSVPIYQFKQLRIFPGAIFSVLWILPSVLSRSVLHYLEA
jgi:hypothetical protein